MDIKEEEKINSGKNVQSKGHFNSCNIVYHLPKISERGLKDFSSSTLQF